MSSARRPAKCRIACLRCAGQNRPPVQRSRPRPLRARRSSRTPGTACGMRKTSPRRGRAVGQHRRRPPGSRRRRAGRSRCRRSARPCGGSRTSLCSVALLTVTPPTNTGSSLATGVSLPVRPTWTSMPFTCVSLLLRRVLVRHRPARLARYEAELAAAERGRRPCRRRRRCRRAGGRASLRDRRVERDQRRRRPATRRCSAATGRPIASKRVQQPRCASAGHAPARDLAEAVGEEAQRPLGRDRLGVELAHRRRRRRCAD